MKKIILFGHLMMLCCLMARAQSDSTATHPYRRLSAEKKAQRLSRIQARTLHLSRSQEQKIMAINTALAKKMDATRTGQNMDRDTRLKAIKALKEERNNRYQEVMTADQYKKWNDYEMKKKEMRKEHRDENKTNKLEAKMAKRETQDMLN